MRRRVNICTTEHSRWQLNSHAQKGNYQAIMSIIDIALKCAPEINSITDFNLKAE